MGSDSFTGLGQHFSSLPVQNLKVSSPTIDLLTLDSESVAEQQVVCVNCMHVLHEVSH